MTTVDTDHLRFEFDTDRGVATLTLNRPDKLNAITDAMLEGIAEAVDACQEYDAEADGVAVNTLVLEAAGDRAFSAGYDVSQFDEKTYPVEERAWRAATNALESYDVPVIAKIDGYCLGGGLELALACDFRIASLQSEFGFPEVDIGLFPSGGGTQRLQPLVGPARTKELCMTGQRFDGSTALKDGLVTDAVPTADLDGRIAEFVDDLVSKPPLSIRAVKNTVDTGQGMSREEALEYERQVYQPLLWTEDHAEGVAAFDEDREPEWTGR
ncbi:enoyl-CoA hydratase/isomerase family protein [Natronomonas gomsonensis]|uniref:enoyl-CoA hydratase/isomerase family protein n=1 Tax=Natronomonas gomsonensis TaxID=1046043 RepID=UPI0020CA595B|nr:enoyl-CoA hydratase/isomerase family protein [Natronomonas gomsonensis]MCY4731576.1 enoyl-CoA hydratase/isomerase family protein [Natronomonas gomsonensis]